MGNKIRVGTKAGKNFILLNYFIKEYTGKNEKMAIKITVIVHFHHKNMRVGHFF